MLKHYFLLFLKGLAMGAANVIPGVSGGTIAFITGIYEDFINALKSFDLTAVKLLFSFNLKGLAAHINLPFLIALFLGVAVSILSLGKLLDSLFETYPMPVWSYFFGLILASVWYVIKNVKTWNASSIITFIVGVTVAVILAFIRPAEENATLFYVMICGVVAISSMILPGLSGSFVLILLGNYQLIMLQAIPGFDLEIIIPFAIGAVVGFLVLSHLISYVLKKAYDQTISLLSGFILGSLVIIWPWKSEIFLMDGAGDFVLKKGEKIVLTYDWYLPDPALTSTWIGVGMMVIGILTVVLIEKGAQKKA